MKKLLLSFLLGIFLPSSSINANAAGAFILTQDVGGEKFPDWTGVTPGADGTAQWNLAAPAVFQYPQGKQGWYFHGFRQQNDSSADWRDFYGIQLDVFIPQGRALELEAVIAIPPMGTRQEYLPQSRATFAVSGDGWQRVTLPWTIFDFEKGRSAFLEFISELRLAGKFLDGKNGEVKLKNVRLVRAPAVAVESDVRGKAVKAGETATFEVKVGNCTDAAQEITLNFERYGWETMSASVEPARLNLLPGTATNVIVSVRVPETGMVPGGYERQQLVAIANGVTLQKLGFITAQDVARPSIQLTPSGWDEVRAKVDKHDWAKREQDRYLKAAENWDVPEAATPPNNISEGHVFSFRNEAFGALAQTAVAWQLTYNTNYAQKVALFLRRLADEKNGYPATFAGTSMGEPQEGGNFQGVAIAYDAIRDAGVLSDEDNHAIQKMFRLYLGTVDKELAAGNLNNWSVAADTGALFCALAMGDLVAAERYLYGPGGFTDFVSKGIMDDGWWWECSTGYNFWVAAELTQCALAMRPWGVDLLNQEFPANFSPRTIITPWGLNPQYGMSLEKWGTNQRNTRSIKQLWDAVPGAADYRGVMFGMNDGHEEQVGGSQMELAYYAFRDPAYLPLLKQAAHRDLIYGVAELPEPRAAPYLNSSLAENIGYALLRSQTTNRPPREQIEAVFKIGTQGGYHGHFDRCSLNTIMRYGRSFWNPESIWWGYPNYLYKFYVQTSVAHNMVVVDQKQQEAVPSSQFLFYSGKMMQVSAQETAARWSDPPYGGMEYDNRSFGGAVKDFPAGMKRNRQSVPLATDRKQGELGPFSDRVLQRRLGIVTDDYIVIADYLKGEQPHTFDNLFQMKSLQSLEAPDKKLLRHDPQFNPDPHSAAQFITDCDWYQASAPAIGKFKVESESGGRSPAVEPGVLKLDVHSLWPLQQKLMLAQPPENLGGQQWVTYEISADGKMIAHGESGMWILGAVDIDVPVNNAKELTVKLTTDGGETKSLFLANARIVTVDGKESSLDAKIISENIIVPAKAGEDYSGGPIKLAGVIYTNTIPAQPADKKKPGAICIPLNKNAVRFKATLAADYPVGDESQRRKIFASRAQGTEARFLTVIEPYEDKPMVKSAAATSADTLRIELTDGRAQEIQIQHFDGNGKNLSIRIIETRGNKVTRDESTNKND